MNADAAQGDKYLDAKEQIAALDKKGNLTSAETSQRNMLAQYVKDIDDGLSPAQAEAAEAGRTSEALKPAPAAKSAPPAGEAEAPATSAAAEGEKPPAGNGEAASASEPEAAPNAGTEPPTTLGQAANATTKEQQANVAGLMGQAARNEPGAAERLAAIIQPDETTLQAARDLGTESHLDLGMISGNKSVREVAGGLATVQGSGASAARIAAINGQAQRAHDIMQALEGTGDISAINNQARQGLTDTQQALQQQGDAAYAQLRANIPKQAPAPATNTLNFIGQRAADLGGADALSPEEKTISRLLTPKSAETPMPEPPAPNPDTGKITPQQFKEYMKQRQAWQDAAGKESKPPTYARLDDVRKDIGRAIAKRQGPFKDADRSLLETLYGHLTADQGAVAQAHGMGDVWKDAKAAVAQRKGVEMRMQKLFGKNLDSTMNAQLGSASDALAKGDVSKLTNLIKAMPPEMKQRVTATALYSSMLKNTRDGRINFANFTKFYEGLARNKQVYSAVMANLPEGAAKQLNSVYHIASAITRANEDVVRTGVIQGLTPQFQGADSILSKLYGVGAHVAANAGHSAGLAVLGHVVGLPGAGEVLGVTKAVISALRAESDKPDAIKAVDTLIASPEFRAGLVKHAQGDTKGAASQIAYSKPFLKFARALGNPRELTDKEKFIMQALNEKNNETEPTPENKK